MRCFCFALKYVRKGSKKVIFYLPFNPQTSSLFADFNFKWIGLQLHIKRSFAVFIQRPQCLEQYWVRMLVCSKNFGPVTWNSFTLILSSLCCDLEGNTGMVLEENVNDTFVYNGLTDDQRKSIKTLIFRTSHVAFVPRETFNTFPSLNRICFHDTDLDYLSADYFRFFPKNHKITGFDFYGCKIDKIDPDVWQYIKNANIFFFQGNVCLNESFTDPKVLFAKMQKCFRNFRQSSLYTNKLIIENSAKNEKSTKTDRNILRRYLEFLEEMP